MRWSGPRRRLPGHGFFTDGVAKPGDDLGMILLASFAFALPVASPFDRAYLAGCASSAEAKAGAEEAEHVPVIERVLPGTTVLRHEGFQARYVTDGLANVVFGLAHVTTLSELAVVVPGALPARSPFGVGYLADVPVSEVAVYLDGVRLLRP